MAGSYSLDSCRLEIGSFTITGLESASDSISFAPVGDDGDMTYGTNGDAVFVHSSNKGYTVTIKTLQHTETNQILNDLRNDQVNYPRTAKPLPIYFKDLINGDEIYLTNCYFTTPPTITRGNAHNSMTWTLKGVMTNIKLK